MPGRRGVGAPGAGGRGGRSPRHSGMEPVASHRQLVEEGDPVLVHQLSPVLLGKISDVGHEGGDQQHVPAQRLLLLSELLH